MPKRTISYVKSVIADGFPQVGLWPETPTQAPGGRTSADVLRHLFPSGRQALTAALRHLGFGRSDYVAIPDWSSSCLISAVGAVVTPVPLSLTEGHGSKIRAVLHYDQWGWPSAGNALRHYENMFGKVSIIADLVDTPLTGFDGAIDRSHFDAAVFSLSKTLGLIGGGFVSCKGEWLKPPRENDHDFDWIMKSAEADGMLAHIAKSFINQTPPALLSYLACNELWAAARLEQASRARNLRRIVERLGWMNWPIWMKDAVEGGAAPTIAPLLIGGDKNVLEEAARRLSLSGVQTSHYHFNLGAHAGSSKFKPCLAFPVHGHLTERQLEQSLDCIFELIRGNLSNENAVA